MIPRSYRSPFQSTAYRLVLAAALTCTPGAARAQAPFSVLHHFASPLSNPKAGLVEAEDGTLLGIAAEGGRYGRGGIYALGFPMLPDEFRTRAA